MRRLILVLFVTAGVQGCLWPSDFDIERTDFGLQGDEVGEDAYEVAEMDSADVEDTLEIPEADLADVEDASEVEEVDSADAVGDDQLIDATCSSCQSYEKCCGGVCVDTAVNRNHCGGCGVSCPGETQICAQGVCQCPAGSEACGTECFDLNTDPFNCGGCGISCEREHAQSSCLAGECQFDACEGDYDDCDTDFATGCETDTSSDTAHCGGCNVACSDTQICVDGGCVCPAGMDACGDECFDFNSDFFNCGGCGLSCERDNAVTSCSGGACHLDGCETGYENCDGNLSSGCEVDITDDPSNCGGCGFVCDDPWLRVCKPDGAGSGFCGCGCGNGVCDDELEPADCPEDCPYVLVCGDLRCDDDEGEADPGDPDYCPGDCQFTEGAICGDGNCLFTGGENFSTCPGDCGNHNPLVGDGVCLLGEDCFLSPEDCGGCNVCVGP